MPQPIEPPAIEAVLRGDAGALGRLLEAHQGRIYNVCLRMTGNRDDAAEIAQEAMLKVVEHIQSFHGQSENSTWMVRIAMNLSISHLRKRASSARRAAWTARRGETRRINRPRCGRSWQITGNRRRDSNVQQREAVVQLQAALGRIEEDFRAILILRDIEGLDYQQIADVLALPVGTVKSRLFRARLSLRHEVLKVSPQPAKG